MFSIGIHYGHWRETLRHARDFAIKQKRSDADQIAAYSTSIIMSRTALEIFLNESWSTFNTNQSKRKYSEYTNTTVVSRYQKYIENIDVHPDRFKANVDRIKEKINLTNKIRNYCIHYTAQAIAKETEECLRGEQSLYSECANEATSPQTLLLNKRTADWCFHTVCEAIKFGEQYRSPRSAMSLDYIAFCEKVAGKNE